MPSVPRCACVGLSLTVLALSCARVIHLPDETKPLTGEFDTKLYDWCHGEPIPGDESWTQGRACRHVVSSLTYESPTWYEYLLRACDANHTDSCLSAAQSALGTRVQERITTAGSELTRLEFADGIARSRYENLQYCCERGP